MHRFDPSRSRRNAPATHGGPMCRTDAHRPARQASRPHARRRLRAATAASLVLAAATLIGVIASRADDDVAPAARRSGPPLAASALPVAPGAFAAQVAHDASASQVALDATRAIAAGRQTFRFDTFGNEGFWGGTLRLHDAIRGAALGGVGSGLAPRAALALGLKVDADALPPSLVQALRRGEVNLDDPATTIGLLQLDAVVGVRGAFRDGRLDSVGITCALCHSGVDDSLAPGIGHRLDGWANRDLDVGSIVALAPDLGAFANLLHVGQDTVRQVLRSWGPGKFDAALMLDGKVANPSTGRSAATLLPPAFGLAGVNLHTWTGWGSVTHWNALVANLEMHGKGTFFDPRLDDPVKFPIAAANGFGHVRSGEDLVTPKLADLHLYQLALRAPAPPAGSFDADAAARGEKVFTGKAQCSTCHVPPLFTDPGWNLHSAAEIGIDDFQAMRSPDGRYRTAPLKGMWTHRKGGFYHDGRFATLREVIGHYEAVDGFTLTEQERDDLVQYLLSL
jgi:hypothetical protein